MSNRTESSASPADGTKKLKWISSALLAASVAGAGYAQAPFLDEESERYRASAAAGLRASNLCNGVWQGGLSQEVVEREINARDQIFGILPSPPGTTIDQVDRTVAVPYVPDMPPRIAVWRPVLGCVLLPVGAAPETARFLPQVAAEFRPPVLDSLPWPQGDQSATSDLPAAQHAALEGIVAAAFDGETYGGRTWAVLVVEDGRIVAERYAAGFDMHSAPQTHSAAKSYTSTLAGVATERGLLDLDRPALLPAWNEPADPRRAITLRHLLHMSSGLYTEGAGVLFLDVYTQGAKVRDLAPTNFLESDPGSRFVYSPVDTMLIMHSIREAMADDGAFLRFPYEALFWKIGMTRTSMTGDWDGSIFGSGQSWSSARDFARFGLLYLNDGVWQGERLLPPNWRELVTTPAPAQPDAPPYYGGQFWLFGGMSGLPADAFTPIGAQGQSAMIIPSRQTVIVRRGFDHGSAFAVDRFSADVLDALAN
jgi:CubicO group peptidase (beta-lactamase class C family)